MTAATPETYLVTLRRAVAFYSLTHGRIRRLVYPLRVFMVEDPPKTDPRGPTLSFTLPWGERGRVLRHEMFPHGAAGQNTSMHLGGA